MATPYGKVTQPEWDALMRRAADSDLHIATAAQRQLAKALTIPLREGVMDGETIGGIFEATVFMPGEEIKYPLDFITPGTEHEYIAYVVPSVGRIEDRHVEGDYIMVPVYRVGSSIDTDLDYLENARWDVVTRMLQVLEAMFVRKANKDGWQTLIAAAEGRNFVVYDDAATAGLFTKRVINEAQILMRRNGGGNSTSLNRSKLTDVYMSPEAVGDIRSWDLTQIDDETRRGIFLSDDDDVFKIYGVLLHAMDEFGVGQEYQDFFGARGGTMPSDKVEVMVGLDRSKNDSFVMPVRKVVQVFEDPTYHRQNRVSLYARGSHGFACLDSRRTIALAC